jgi:hypothetical protein
MLYDTALDDGPMLIDNPPCLHEHKNYILVIHDDALIHESPILFLKSPIYTIEEKCGYVGKYLCGLQFPYEKSYCNHDAMIKNDIGNYFERGKHDNESLSKLENPLYVPKISKLHDSNIHTIEFTPSNCNYYERGGVKNPFYASSNDIMCSPTNDMQWHTSTYCYLVIYKIPMHRKKVRICCYYFHILWCSLPCFSLTIILMITPWDPGIMYGKFSKEEGECSKVQVPS